MSDERGWTEPGGGHPPEMSAASGAQPDQAPVASALPYTTAPTPGPVAPAAYYPPPPRPLEVRAYVAIGWLVLSILVSAWVFVHDVQGISLMNEIESGEFGDDLIDRAEAWDTMDLALVFVELGTLIACGVAFIVWLWQARGNVDSYGWTRQRKTRGWAIGGWFVPIVNLWYPFQLVADVWKASHPAREPDEQELSRLGTGRLLGWWWGFWLASNLIGWGLLRSSASETPADIRSQEGLSAFDEAISIGAAVFAILVVRQITRFQGIRARAAAPWAVDRAELPRLPSLRRN